MSSTNRKPLSPIDGNRLQQLQNKLPYHHHHHRRRITSHKSSSSSTTSMGNQSVASLVDDHGFDFLTNPKSSSKVVDVVSTKSIIKTKPSTGPWTSTSKTPKISNVTGHEHTYPSQPLVTTTTTTTQYPTEPNDVRTNGGKDNVASSSNVIVRRPKRFQNKRNVLRTSKPRLEDHHPSLSAGSCSTDGVSLETIIEGTQEEENESPISIPANISDLIQDPSVPTINPIIQSNDNIHDTTCTSVPINNRNQELQIIMGQQQQHHDDDDDSAHGSDMDICSDDDLMGLTLSPPPVDIINHRNHHTEHTNHDTKETVAMMEQSKPESVVSKLKVPSTVESVPLRLPSNTVHQQDQMFCTPTQPETKTTCNMKPTSCTPYPVLPNVNKFSSPIFRNNLHNRSSQMTKQPSINGLQQFVHNTPVSLGESKRQMLVEQINIHHQRSNPGLPRRPIRTRVMDHQFGSSSNKNNNTHGTPAPQIDHKPNKTVSDVAMTKFNDDTQIVHHKPVTTNNEAVLNTERDFKKIDTNRYSASKPSVTKDLESKFIVSKKQGSNEHSMPIKPINEKVWQAMMIKPEKTDQEDVSGLVGLIIKTPARRDTDLIEESESIDGSEITQDTCFLLTTHNTSPNVDNHNVEPSGQPNQDISTGSDTRHQNQITPAQRKNVIIDRICNSQIAKEFKINNHAFVRPKLDTNSSLQPPSMPLLKTPLSIVQRIWPNPSKMMEKRWNHSIENNASDEKLKSSHHMLQLLEEDVYSGILSSTKKKQFSKHVNPELWTATIAGQKYKAFGVNAAPVFRLSDGKLYQHPPLPPGWTVGVSRTKDMPFYIHPDFGTTFYSPVPLPTEDGVVVGTTLLFQADTPMYRQPIIPSKSPNISTPVVFGLQVSNQKSDQSSVVSYKLEKRSNNTPLGALVVASQNLFSDSQHGMISNESLHKNMNGESQSNSKIICESQHKVDMDGNDKSNGTCTTSSTGSSYSCETVSTSLSKRSIPFLIDIVHKSSNLSTDERFKLDLNATSGYETPNAMQDANSQNQSPKPNVALIHSTAFAYGIKNDVALVAGVSAENSDKVASGSTVHCKTACDDKNQHNHSACNDIHSSRKRKAPDNDAIKSDDSCETDDIEVSVGDFEYHSPSIPQNVDVLPDDDDISLLQCTPVRSKQITTISTRFNPKPASADAPNSDEMSLYAGDHDDDFIESNVQLCSNNSVVSYTSARSSLSRASHRSLHPMLPLCSLQNLQNIIRKTRSDKKKKNTPQNKSLKTMRKPASIPVSE